MDYIEFLKSKNYDVPRSGFEPIKSFNTKLFDWQQDIVSWGIRRGTAALFEDCGLGKTAQQLEWADHIVNYTGGKVLIVAPLAVAAQTQREGNKFDIDTRICRSQSDTAKGINITNYEMLDHFNLNKFDGVVLDESSILKAYMGKTKRYLVEKCEDIPFKLACTATPAPNDHMELLNHAEFLGIMKSSEALSIWFINDTKNSGTYRLKNHAIKSFWEWVSSWAVCLSNPEDLGYKCTGYKLPKLNLKEHIIEIDEISNDFQDGFLRKVETNATAFHKEKKFTAKDRAIKTAEIVRQDNEQYLVWCNTDYEADLLKQYIPNAVEVRGSHKTEYKERAAMDFVDGNTRILISKPKIFGFGLNFQNCHNTVFCGLDYSYESYYQAIRRLWRYGQTQEVNCHIVLGSTEKHILDIIRRKEAQQNEMHSQMYSSITEIQKKKFHGHQFKLNLEAKKITIPYWIRSEVEA